MSMATDTGVDAGAWTDLVENFDEQAECEHSQHFDPLQSDKHDDDGAAYLMRAACLSCGDYGEYLSCATWAQRAVFVSAAGIFLTCHTCKGYTQVRMEATKI